MGGKDYKEMHVDGGAFARPSFNPSAMTANRLQRGARLPWSRHAP